MNIPFLSKCKHGYRWIRIFLNKNKHFKVSQHQLQGFNREREKDGEVGEEARKREVERQILKKGS
jgi:hypothetical protein